MSHEELKHPGIVKAELKLYYANAQALATSFFTFTISKTLEDQNIVPVAEYYIDDFETLRDGINQTVDEISLREKFVDFEAIETKEGAQIKADSAENNAKDYPDEHANDQVKHITAKELHGMLKKHLKGLSEKLMLMKAKRKFTSHQKRKAAGMMLLINLGRTITIKNYTPLL